MPKESRDHNASRRPIPKRTPAGRHRHASCTKLQLHTKGVHVNSEITNCGRTGSMKRRSRMSDPENSTQILSPPPLLKVIPGVGKVPGTSRLAPRERRAGRPPQCIRLDLPRIGSIRHCGQDGVQRSRSGLKPGEERSGVPIRTPSRHASYVFVEMGGPGILKKRREGYPQACETKGVSFLSSSRPGFEESDFLPTLLPRRWVRSTCLKRCATLW